MERMPISKSESLKFYKYLCQKIGSEKVVRTRRLAFTIRDMGHCQHMITSGSKGEGLDLSGSDFDYMLIDNFFKVYQSETEVQSQCLARPLIMNTEETQPCFTQLWPLNQNINIVPNLFERNYRGYKMLSGELYKLCSKNGLSHVPGLFFGKIHGPCISNENETVDVARCLKCDKWICQAKPWIGRPRKTWPLPEIISKINVYEEGINCFASSETLRDYHSQSYDIDQSFGSGNSMLLQQIMPTLNLIRGFDEICRFPRLVYNFLHHSRTSLSRILFALQISEVFMHVPQETQYQYYLGNKRHYLMYKRDLGHLVIGFQSDAVSGLLKLASFFYVHKMYTASLTVIRYTLPKCTEEKIVQTFFRDKTTFNNIQKHVLNLMKKESLYTMIRSLTIHHFRFGKDSSIIPQELQLDVTRTDNCFHPSQFANFLSFLCNYQLHDLSSCRQSLLRLQVDLMIQSDFGINFLFPETVNSVIFCGIANQLLSNTYSAMLFFQIAVKIDIENKTSAASRVSSLI
ncbi:unnamed protein product [Mytilus coruscus]|uniref:Mab-21-like HhH/H2TH-like domain-containing protein n=1 Tax=Mytilus coruscus TaxID=42192 RepID=A0A6J8AR78_MYTCO|nr:unnamed protein product [Mytilus coruscus]